MEEHYRSRQVEAATQEAGGYYRKYFEQDLEVPLYLHPAPTPEAVEQA